MKVLVASDLTAAADRALARAASLARQPTDTIHVVHVVDASLPHDLQGPALEWARTVLARQLEDIQGPRTSFEVVAGRLRPVILAQLKSLDADLLVLGRRDPDPEASPFIETAAGHLLRECQRPALVVRDAPRQPYQNVVIGVDFSVQSRAALRQARQVAPDACLHLVHADDNPFADRPEAAELGSLDYSRRLEHEAFLAAEMELLTRALIEAGHPADRLTSEIAEGTPEAALGQAFRRTSADLLIIGTHGRTGLFRALWGSVATRLLETPFCDTLVVKAP
ncbi:universal stress protein [Pararhodospirillum photometricum]|uniref:Universal stress protein, putative n=1 Tax=Pararhodospirillum photometricum DSM 122 TaxID=1150469 RepID=H6SJ14_PARPM|nr:universal stress protein [Pararhodospirillum photometricum]CCG07979.1 Universal stress protein, putative [Pararhodospirillum photometricum DSM 122]